MTFNTPEGVKKFHYEEILLILFVCSTDVGNSNEDDLIDFAEIIEGRVDILFEADFIQTYNDYFNLDPYIIENFSKLRSLLMKLYASQWHNKINENDPKWKEIKIIAKKILISLNITYIEPKRFIDEHMEY